MDAWAHYENTWHDPIAFHITYCPCTTKICSCPEFSNNNNNPFGIAKSGEVCKFYSGCLLDANGSTDKMASVCPKLNSPYGHGRAEKHCKLYQMHSAPKLVQAVAEKCGASGERRAFIKILWPCFLPSEWSWLIGKSMKCCENCTSMLHTKIQLFTWDEDCLWFIYSLKTH